MPINPSIFKAYDIRGVYSDEINEETAFLIGRAFITYLKINRQMPSHIKIIISRDARPSSLALENNLIKGLVSENVKIIRTGLTSTPMHYWIINKELADAGVMVTASHNPKKFNGFKISKETAIPMGFDSGLKEIKNIMEKKSFENSGSENFFIYDQNYLKEYVHFLTNNLKLLPMKIAIDNGNGMAGLILTELFKEFPMIKIIPLYFEPNGAFPNHEANPLKEETLTMLKNTIKIEKADLGIAFDGDGDRVFFLTSFSQRIPADLITALVAEDYLKKNPGAKIIYDPRSSKIVGETIEKNNGKPIISQVGHAFFKRRLRQEEAVFGGELSGHYYFKDFFNADSGIFAMLKILSIISENKKSLEDLIQPFKKYFQSGEINFEIKNREEAIKRIEKNYENKAEKIDKIDGLTMEFDWQNLTGGWWFNVRPSNTESLLRLNLEAKTDYLMREKIKEILDLILN
ncbi:MAG: phosphomannomutase/phosphoglucomutase [Parcubacteria group bacterium]|nr:phosphomannomutase/phosphoglucomutase [Parcubacteria group bacterium]